MASETKAFRYESLEDQDSIADLLKALTSGIKSGKLSFSDDNGELSMTPHGLINFKLTANKEEGRNRVNLRVTWHDADDQPNAGGKLKIKSK
ncbi:amphi-Trp domain-containing protein [Neiella marina]|uniref:Amphi-Trp domain-containing protein n=1 Tax=Neiella holothuriorum TaxID=2870530 RepID=A0ABS7ED23_9GAMM|nr:amphi-Trp domain-containing protein [Neiella holothuriorum]MBW8190239.1 amphi-Trp domain-containing protein [Neiella holothuriorum]